VDEEAQWIVESADRRSLDRDRAVERDDDGSVGSGRPRPARDAASAEQVADDAMDADRAMSGHPGAP
jgi:hypothetical protein